MNRKVSTDWNPEAYARFRGARLRPALDLLAQVGALPAGDVVDLGCGDGAVAAALRAAFPDRRLIGIDASPAMLAKAQGYDALIQADIAEWQPEIPPALIYSNAALQWLPDHDRLLPHLARMVAPGGVLAIQMPRQSLAPSHRFLRDIAAAMYPDRFDYSAYVAPVGSPAAYWPILAPLGDLDVWQTKYLQRLEPSPDAHPVRRFTEGSAMREVLDKLTPSEMAAFVAAYDTALMAAYPLLPDGAALFPFRRLFMVLRVTG
ncbi:methyltransferase domain-containing protein [Gemmobacter serpentinus]|uniref:methyltransferase domain-containing protein n=1 Tax=Gemmobacter serpentinus TaxID=2652247 RepID=UPI00124CA54A|nr:methyltransferase domain-containing protein [Gemmobacter serpentinus]